MDTTGLPEGIDRTHLRYVVALLLDQEVETLLEWTCQPLYEPRVNTTHGVYLLTGIAIAVGNRREWSVVLKLLAASPDGDPPLEAILYRSELLASLQHGLTAPHCFAVTDLPNSTTGLWMESLHESAGMRWTVAQFGLTASHLGFFNATQTSPGRSRVWPQLPRIDWRMILEGYDETISHFRHLQTDLVIRHAYPAHIAEGFLYLWDVRHSLLHALEHAQHMVSHGDAQRRNLFPGKDRNGRVCTIAIDWANTSLRPVGADVATLMHQALLYFDVDARDIEEFDRDIFRCYLDGLSLGGWDGDHQAVRVAYATQLALGVGLGELGWVLRLAQDENRWHRAEMIFRRPLTQILERRAAINDWLMIVVQEVYACMNIAS